MGTDKKKWISIMIVPEDGSSLKKWRITLRRYSIIKKLFWVVVFFLFAGFASTLGMTYMFFQVRNYKMANEDLLEATSKVEMIARRLSDYEKKESKLREILEGDLGLPKPLTVERLLKEPDISNITPGDRINELEEAIAREEANIRRKPTIWPVNVWQVTKEFKYTGNARVDHTGIDILSWGESPVVTAADGKVTFADRTDRLGNRIEIDHGNGWVTEYGHTSTILVKYGDDVKKGQTIALFGGNVNSGSGPHLHYGMYYNKQPVNPLDFIKSGLKLSIKE